MFFPEYLNQGSDGRAVTLLQLMLLFAGYNPRIIPDGDYGKETAEGVKLLQRSLGLAKDDVDGHFGPKTRAALLKNRSIDINNIPVNAFSRVTVAVGP